MLPSGTQVAVISDAHAYAMYVARELTCDGAVLTGPLLHELDEELTVEIAFEGATPIRLKARVDRVDRGDPPGMAVSFSDVTEADRNTLASKLRANHG